MGLADTARLAVQLDLKGNFAAQLRANQKMLGAFDAQVQKTQSRAYRAGTQIGTGIKNTARIATGIVAAGAGIVAASLKVTGDFEAQLNTINTIARESPAGLKKIGDSIRQVAKDTGTSLDDLTQGYYDLLSAGVKAADAQNVLRQANTLAIGGLSSTAEAIDLLTTTINTYGGDASKAAQYTDVFAKAIERGKVTAAELAQSFATVGPIAANAGIDVQELGAAYARLTASGVPAAEAATQVRSAIQSLSKVTPDLAKLEKQTGKNYLAIAGKQGLVVALEQMRNDAKKAGIPLVELTGRIEAQSFILQTTGKNFDAYKADLAAMGNASGTAAKQMAERQQGLNFQLARLKALAKDAGISIGSALLPKITPLIAKLNEFVGGAGAQNAIKQFGDNIAGLFSDKNIQSGINALKDGFETAKAAAPVLEQSAKATLGIVKAAVDLFKGLPPEIQQLAVGAFAVNKLTGGLVTNIVGGIGDFLLKQRGATPANPLFVVDVSGGVGGIAGAAGGGGILAIGKTLLTTVAIPAVVGLFLAGKIAGVGPFRDTTPVEKRTLSKADIAAIVNANLQATNGRQPGSILDRGGREQGGSVLAGKIKDDFASLKYLATLQRSANLYLRDGFRRMVAGLRDARGDKAIRAALKELNTQIFTKGIGGSGGAKNALKELKSALSRTHDPQLQRALRAEIAKVEKKIVGRQYVERQINKADQILKSNRSTDKKIADLKVIERALKDRGVPNAAKQIRDKIEQAKRAQVYAQHASTQAIKDKDLSITNNISVNTSVKVSSRETSKTETTFKKYYVTAS